jgi:hypothetical protein
MGDKREIAGMPSQHQTSEIYCLASSIAEIIKCCNKLPSYKHTDYMDSIESSNCGLIYAVLPPPPLWGGSEDNTHVYVTYLDIYTYLIHTQAYKIENMVL